MSRDDQNLKTTHTADDLVSVTVRKDDSKKKAGITLVERKGAIYVTKIAEDGLFFSTDVGVGDVLLSLNGKRIRKGEQPAEIVKAITRSKATVTVVIKKTDRKARRGVRSLSPTKQRKLQRGNQEHRKGYKGMRRRNPDGSLKMYDPKDDAWAKKEEYFDEIHISAQKIFAKQQVGIQFHELDGMVFVAKISSDSVFRDTKLEVGDRIVQINEMNFREYANKEYAKKMMARTTDEVEFIVEKGRQNLQQSGASLPDSDEEEAENLNKSFSRKLRILRSKSPGRRPERPESDDDELNARSEHDSGGPLKLEELKHDFMRATLKRGSDGEYGVKTLRRGGKLYVKVVPNHEKRFTTGDEILGINLTKARTLSSSDEADQMIENSGEGPVVVINFDDPRARKIDCPCCGAAMRTDGTGHVSGPMKHQSVEQQSVAAPSEATEPASNRGRGRSGYDAARARRAPAQSKYNVDEFDSESDSGSDSDSDDSDSDSDDSTSLDRGGSTHNTNEKFLVSVRKIGRKAPGIRFFEYKGELFVSAISEAGLFRKTAVQPGDQVLSINGKKTGGNVDASFAEDILEEKDLLSCYFKRLDPNSKLGQEVFGHLG